MQHLKGQHVLILGLGASGLAMAKWCASLGASVTVADSRTEPPNLSVLKKECPGAQFKAGAFSAELLQLKAQTLSEGENPHIRAVFKSPGLTPKEVAPVWDAAKESGLWVGTELSLFAKALAQLKEEMGYEPDVLGVTGTNGKTTVTSLTAQMLSRGGVKAVVAGNIGPTLLDTLAEQLAEIKDVPLDIDEEDAVEGVNEVESAVSTLPIKPGHEDDQVAKEDRVFSENSQAKNSINSDLATEIENDPLDTDHGDGVVASEFEAEISNKLATDPQVSANAESSAQDESEESLVLNLPRKDVNPEHKKYKSRRSALPQAWVLELSSFQLNDCDEFDPTASVILNISEDHLDWHLDMKSYVGAKSKIFGVHTHQILCRDDPQVLSLRALKLDAKALKKAKAAAELNETPWFEREVLTYGSDLPTEPGHYGLETVNGMTWLVKAVDPSDDEGEVKSRRRKNPVQPDELIMQRLMPADALRIRGAHNALNALAALALCSTTKATSVGHGPMLYALREYRGEPHRVEPVSRINDVEYFDDSKGTNVGATIAAIKGLGAEHSLIVILGGEGKGQDFTPLAEPLSKYAKLIVLIGRDAPIIKESIKGCEVRCIDAVSMQEAVSIAHQHAQFGDAVLMSPACASFDMFENYEHRAQVFIQAVQALALEEGVV